MAESQHKLKFDKDAVHDLVLLSSVSTKEVARQLKNRFKKDTIYTYVGDVLVSVNPFKQVDFLTEAEILDYQGKFRNDKPPHVHAISDDAHRGLVTSQQKQCIVISGESGAGKTEASKVVMKYIALVSGSSSAVAKTKDMILKTNPVLEAFGNAKTLRNDNSSRFGKYFEIVFDSSGDPVGGHMYSFLLETQRVASPGAGERNFHIFYQLLAGLDATSKEYYFLQGRPQDFQYLSKSGCFAVDTMDDAKEFREMLEGLTALGVTDAEMNSMYCLLSAVLWMGEINFEGDERATIAAASAGAVGAVAQCLGCTAEQLGEVLVKRHIKAGMDLVQKDLNPAAAYLTRDSLAKMLYSAMFDWLVQRINTAIEVGSYSTESPTIGILDIYGFEIFEVNSFEQFLINYANEKLQQIFIQNVLKSEQEEYSAEGITWVDIPYFDNVVVCELIEQKDWGLIRSLNDEGIRPKGSSEKWYTALETDGDWAAHAQFSCNGHGVFTIAHYAGPVQYDSSEFMSKNKDSKWKDLVDLCETHSNLVILHTMYPQGSADEMQRKRPSTSGTQFKKSINQLVTALAVCKPHYIRCIKSNSKKKSGTFENDLVQHQVNYLGLLENIRVRKAGYCARLGYDEFYNQYYVCSSRTEYGWSGDARGATVAILEDMGFAEGAQYTMGKTKVFIREPADLFKMDQICLDKKIFLERKKRGLGLFDNRKRRRRESFSRVKMGDYVGAKSEEKLLQELRASYSDPAEVLFAAEVDKVNQRFQSQRRLLVLTKQAVYNVKGSVGSSLKVKRRIPVKDIERVSLSRHADNYFCIHCPRTYDYVYAADHQTEFIKALYDLILEVEQRDLSINFRDEFTYKPYENKEKMSSLKFVERVPKDGSKLHAARSPDDKTQFLVEINYSEGDMVSEQEVLQAAEARATRGPGAGTSSAASAGYGGGAAAANTLAVPGQGDFQYYNYSSGSGYHGAAAGRGGGAAAAPAATAAYGYGQQGTAQQGYDAQQQQQYGDQWYDESEAGGYGAQQGHQQQYQQQW